MHHISSVICNILPGPLLQEWDTGASPPAAWSTDWWWLLVGFLPGISRCPRLGSLSSGIQDPVIGQCWNTKVQPPCLNPGQLWRVIQVPYFTLGLTEASAATVSYFNSSLYPILLLVCSQVLFWRALRSKPPARSPQCLFPGTLSFSLIVKIRNNKCKLLTPNLSTW